MRTIYICLLLIISFSFSGCRKSVYLKYVLINESGFDLNVEVNADSKRSFVLKPKTYEEIYNVHYKTWSKIGTQASIYIKELNITNDKNVKIKKDFRNQDNWQPESFTRTKNIREEDHLIYLFFIENSDF